MTFYERQVRRLQRKLHDNIRNAEFHESRPVGSGYGPNLGPVDSSTQPFRGLAEVYRKALAKAQAACDATGLPGTP
jgi:hypothetical protein